MTTTSAWLPSYHREDFEILQVENCYSGFCPVNRYHFRFRLFKGGWSIPISRECIHRSAAAAVLLYDPIQDLVVMLEQIRVGFLDTQQSPWVLEIVAGMIDAEETPEQTAYRETLEETGYSIQTLTPIMQYLVSPGICDELTYVYCGIVEAKATGELAGLIEEGEDIKTHVLSALSCFKLLEEGQIKSASAVIALQWLKIHRPLIQSSR